MAASVVKVDGGDKLGAPSGPAVVGALLVGTLVSTHVEPLVGPLVGDAKGIAAGPTVVGTLVGTNVGEDDGPNGLPLTCKTKLTLFAECSVSPTTRPSLTDRSSFSTWVAARGNSSSWDVATVCPGTSVVTVNDGDNLGDGLGMPCRPPVGLPVLGIDVVPTVVRMLGGTDVGDVDGPNVSPIAV